MELEILVLPIPNPIGIQVCDDEGGGPCSYDGSDFGCPTDICYGFSPVW